MDIEKIKNKKIGIYADNCIEKYKDTDNISFQTFIHKYLSNDGFFVIIDKNEKPIKYIDMVDFKQIKILIDDFDKNKKKSLKTFINNAQINTRNNFIDYDEKLIDVLKILNKNNQNYYPIIKNNILIGRISKKILMEKLEELY